MNRRALLVALGATPILLTRPTLAQTTNRARRVGLLILGVEDAVGRPLVTTFRERLQQLGWLVDQSLQIDVRWAGNDIRGTAAELVRSEPNVIVVQGTQGTEAVLLETRRIATVFVQVTDPAAAGFVASLSRPGGNVTGVANVASSIAGDRLRVLKDISPGVTRVLLIHDRNYPTPPGLLRATETAAGPLGLELIASGARDADELAHQIRDLASASNGGLVVLPSPFTVTHSQRIIELAAQHRLPAIYPLPNFPAAGGLISYGVNTPALWQEAATYVDRILRGANPGELPVHEPSVDIVVNQKTAKALGFIIPRRLLDRASKVID
jgi:putative tryptophan/tyrosine transport system substrate-binding protein